MKTYIKGMGIFFLVLITLVIVVWVIRLFSMVIGVNETVIWEIIAVVGSIGLLTALLYIILG